MKNIMLLTDFSINAQNAIDFALQFFKGGTYKFFILNVQKVSNYGTSNLMASSPKSSLYDSIIKNPKAMLNKLIEQLKKTYKNEVYSFESICDYDDFVSAVSQTVKSKSIELIVMGTNGATGAKEVVFGSNTINIIRKVNSPVLVIPQDYKYKIPNSILFTTSCNERFREKPLNPLMHIISKFNLELNILTLEDEKTNGIPIDKKVKMDDFFHGINYSFYSIESVPSDIAIDSFVQIKQVDLTAMVIDKESFFKRLLSGSKTDEITYKSRVPLLIMHP